MHAYSFPRMERWIQGCTVLGALATLLDMSNINLNVSQGCNTESWEGLGTSNSCPHPSGGSYTYMCTLEYIIGASLTEPHMNGTVAFA